MTSQQLQLRALLDVSTALQIAHGVARRAGRLDLVAHIETANNSINAAIGVANRGEQVAS